MVNTDRNVITKVDARTQGTNGTCHSVKVELDNCSASLDGTYINKSSTALVDGVRLSARRSHIRVSVPNCEASRSIALWVTCTTRRSESLLKVETGWSQLQLSDWCVHMCVDIATCLGSPHSTELLDSEKELFANAGIDPPPNVMLYSSLLLTSSQRVLVAEKRICRPTKCNNSSICFTTGYGLLSLLRLQIIACNELAEDKCFLLLQELVSAPLALCNDQVTHADLSKHFCFSST